MTAQTKHKAADKKLQTLAHIVFERPNSKKELDRIGKKFKVSGQTIRNYLVGFGKDGFLKEDIINEIQRIA